MTWPAVTAALAGVLGSALVALGGTLLSELRGLRREISSLREVLAAVGERVARLEGSHV